MRRFFDKRRMSLGNYTVEECFDARISVNGAVFVEKSHGEVCCRSFLMHARHPAEPGTELTQDFKFSWPHHHDEYLLVYALVVAS